MSICLTLVLLVVIASHAIVSYAVILNSNARSRNVLRSSSISDDVIKRANAPAVHKFTVSGTKFIAKHDGSIHDVYDSSDTDSIKLINCQSGWGNGVHPTTLLCLDYIDRYVGVGDNVLDYGCGSGILSIYAVKGKKASKCYAIDVDDEVLQAANDNVSLNKCMDVIHVTHTKDIFVGDVDLPIFDVTVANILPGPLTRLTQPIVGLTKNEGMLCLSGMRPHELHAVKTVYKPFVDVSTESIAMKSHDIFGQWVSWTVKLRNMDVAERNYHFTALLDAFVGY